MFKNGNVAVLVKKVPSMSVWKKRCVTMDATFLGIVNKSRETMQTVAYVHDPEP